MTVGLILGAAVWEDGASPTLRRRTMQGAALFHAGKVERLILCGGLGKHAPSEAQAMYDILIAVGVPDSVMTLEDQSTTTGENIRNAVPLIANADVIIITDWYHAPRAKLIARRAGLRARSSSPSLRGAKFWPQTKAALREIPAYGAYLLRLKH